MALMNKSGKDTLSTGKKSAYGLDDLWKGSIELQHLSGFGMARHLGFQALCSILASPFASLLSLLTIAVVMFLVAAFLATVSNLGGALGDVNRNLTVSVILKDSAVEGEKAGLLSAINACSEVAQTRFISKPEALSIFRKALGDQAGLLEGLEIDNPLPASIEVTLREDRMLREGFDQFAARFADNAAVESVQYNKGLVGQAADLFRFLRLAGLVSAVLMLVIASFIIANTIRLMLYSRRDEIGIMRMVGATAGFVMAPCLIEGCVLGLMGAVLGLIGLYFTFLLFSRLIAKLDLVNAVMPELCFMPWYYILLVLVLGIVVGTVGSYLSVRRLADE